MRRVNSRLLALEKRFAPPKPVYPAWVVVCDQRKQTFTGKIDGKSRTWPSLEAAEADHAATCPGGLFIRLSIIDHVRPADD